MRECLRCHEVVTIQARGLCAHCYYRSRTDGTIYTYSTVLAGVERVASDCLCTKPLVEALFPWDAYQCSRCGLRITNSRAKELGA